MPLHSKLTVGEKNKVLGLCGTNSTKRGTNIAEMSVTAPNITTVVDSGLAKIFVRDPKTQSPCLSPPPTSRGAAEEQAGRANRLGPGEYYRLYDRRIFTHEMMAQTSSETLRSDPMDIIMKVNDYNNIMDYQRISPPPKLHCKRIEYPNLSRRLRSHRTP